MKKLVCIVLLLWLPLFTGSALAMSTQMQLADTLAPASKAPCHEMQADDHQAATDNAIHSTAEPCCDQNDSSHNCFACGVCAFTHAASNVSANPASIFSTLTAATPQYYSRVFSSQLYPPALKPPIRL